jgi:hypothetical protein
MTNPEYVKISTVDFLINSWDYLLHSLKWIAHLWGVKYWRFVLKLNFMDAHDKFDYVLLIKLLLPKDLVVN